MKVRLGCVTLAILVVAACGSDGSGVSHSAAERLRAQVVVIRAAAGSTDRAAAQQRLAEFLVMVDQSEADGEVSQSAATRIREAACRVQAKLVLLPVPTTTTSTTTVPSSDDDEGKGRGKGKENGKGKGHKKSDE